MRQMNLTVSDDTHAYLQEQARRGRVPMARVVDLLAHSARRLGWQVSELLVMDTGADERSNSDG